MVARDNKEPRAPKPSDETLLSMFSDALGYDVTGDTVLTADEELTAGAEVQARLDAAAELMREDGQVNIGALRDTKAQLALLEMATESNG